MGEKHERLDDKIEGAFIDYSLYLIVPRKRPLPPRVRESSKTFLTELSIALTHHTLRYPADESVKKLLKRVAGTLISCQTPLKNDLILKVARELRDSGHFELAMIFLPCLASDSKLIHECGELLRTVIPMSEPDHDMLLCAACVLDSRDGWPQDSPGVEEIVRCLEEVCQGRKGAEVRMILRTIREWRKETKRGGR